MTEAELDLLTKYVLKKTSKKKGKITDKITERLNLKCKKEF